MTMTSITNSTYINNTFSNLETLPFDSEVSPRFLSDLFQFNWNIFGEEDEFEEEEEEERPKKKKKRKKKNKKKKVKKKSG